jgi:hypothetical protein
MIKITQKGDFKKTHKFLNAVSKNHIEHILKKYGEMGVQALVEATPVTTGKTAGSWDFEIEHSEGSYSIIWTNSNVNNGVNIAVILQYGHGTGTGGYVRGYDYINPALKPVFDELADKVWKEVTES